MVELKFHMDMLWSLQIIVLLITLRHLVLLVLQDYRLPVVLFLLVRGSTTLAEEHLPDLQEVCSLPVVRSLAAAAMTLILTITILLLDVRDLARGKLESCSLLSASIFPLAFLFTTKMVLL
jgi:hypothetical protein